MRVLLLPGAVMPAEAAYGDLEAALGEDVEVVAKDLELYRGEVPPEDYSLATEVEGVRAEADERGWDRFHLVGYSAGGSVALAFAAQEPDRLLSLALLEPAWAGSWDWSEKYAALWTAYEEVGQLPPDQLMGAFMRLQMRSDVDLPPPPSGPAPPWMVKRPGGVAALLETFKTYDLSRAALEAFAAPVYFAIGGRSNPDQYGEEAVLLGRVFSDFSVEEFPERHHFDPPHRVQPDDLARSLRALWERAERQAT